jgi:hypothetical protein
MRYIRSFNEDNSAGLTEDEIKDFCEINLAYLVDEGLRVIVDDYYEADNYYPVILSFRQVENRKWDEVKDHIIPFLIRLKSQFSLFQVMRGNYYYDIELDTLFNSGGEIGAYSHWLTANDLVNDRISDWFRSHAKIKSISFYVKNKKEV